ncbi:hypothetical protein [Tolumonas lignilytica]|uniref:hypothetical protein n=1 Tax=Tolumonas lignilytica TaxID=1283284 RepID=UPI0004670DBD|nr:hypothetical protein [Tolumonas lignilytica]
MKGENQLFPEGLCEAINQWKRVATRKNILLSIEDAFFLLKAQGKQLPFELAAQGSEANHRRIERNLMSFEDVRTLSAERRLFFLTFYPAVILAMPLEIKAKFFETTFGSYGVTFYEPVKIDPSQFKQLVCSLNESIGRLNIDVINGNDGMAYIAQMRDALERASSTGYRAA